MGRRKKEEISEDWCFVCKEGGTLILCEHKDCLKSYHPKCVGKEDSFLSCQDIWRCGWHNCFICKKPAKFHCFCCPNAICGQCLSDAEFIIVQGIKGFCNNCLRLALLWEEKRNVDSDGRKVDFTERGTYEFLFMDYWEIIKKNEGLKLEHLQKASAYLKKGNNFKIVNFVNETARTEASATSMLNLTNYEDWEWDDIEDYVPSRIGKKRKSKALKKRGKFEVKPMKRRSSRKEFLGWGSKPLIEFLTSIGIDTSVELSIYDVLHTVMKYVDDKKLLHPHRKKTIVCDQGLSSLLGKKSVNKHRVYNLLERHYSKNQETSGDDVECSSEQIEERVSQSCSKKRKCGGDERQVKKTFVKQGLVVKDYLASIVPENINLAFLRRSLVEKLLKQPEMLEEKLMGSFLRVKSDPYDIMQHYSHQLVQVTGVSKLPTRGADVEILIQVSSMPMYISIHMISESDFTKDECDQLYHKIKDGVHKKLTVVELEQKVRDLHGDITKHWIERELPRLKNLMDKANETGRRRELAEYTERRNLLLLPNEQLRLINEIPEVKAEDMAPKSESRKLSDAASEDSIGREATGDPGHKAVNSSISAGNGDFRTFKDEEETQECQGGNATDKEPVSAKNGDVTSEGGYASDKEAVTSPVSVKNGDLRTFEMKEQSQEIIPNASDKEAVTSPISAENGDLRTFEMEEHTQQIKGGDAKYKEAVTSPVSAENGDMVTFQLEEQIQKSIGLPKAIETIDLSSDDDDKRSKLLKHMPKEIEPEDWYCMGPLGDIRGPSKVSILQTWKKLCPTYSSKFKVWRKGESPENGIPLSSAFH